MSGSCAAHIYHELGCPQCDESGQRYYQLRAFETAHPESHDGVVSNEELHKRFGMAVAAWLADRPWETVRNILVNGKEGK